MDDLQIRKSSAAQAFRGPQGLQVATVSWSAIRNAFKPGHYVHAALCAQGWLRNLNLYTRSASPLKSLQGETLVYLGSLIVFPGRWSPF